MSFFSTASRLAAAGGGVGGADMTGSTVAHQLQLVGHIEGPAALEARRVPAVEPFLLDLGVGGSLAGPFGLAKTHGRLALFQLHVVGAVERVEDLSDMRILYAVHAALHNLGVGAVAHPDLADDIEAPRGSVLMVGYRLPGAVPKISIGDGPGCDFAWVGVLGWERDPWRQVVTWFQNFIWAQDCGWEHRVAEAGYLDILVRCAAIKGCERLVLFDFEAGAGDIGQRGSLIVVKDIFLLLIAGPHSSVVRKGGWAPSLLQPVVKYRLSI